MSIYQITTQGKVLGQACENVFYVQHDTMTTEILFASRDRITDLWEEYIMPQQCDAFTMNSTSVRRVDVAGYPAVVYGVDPSIQGDRTEDTLPTQSTVNVYLYSNTLKPNKGRKYIGGWSEPGLGGDGLWTGTVVTAVTNFMTNLIMMGDSEPETYAQWVTVRWDAEHEFVEAFNQIESFIVSNIPGTQRRRKIGVGR